ncbi:alpha/beta hydrolase fold domain-containing protein [Sinorhizobium meliloti]|nr:alpha/beta hydrolase fold domain-containing protein [Sinorhizobium meliloti]MDW9844106.1 alpha/beta hydrolase fold domain-containing protein [Sinorhizobium meliloti]MDW9849616.1 alpha/beta hydrolase fold domain-containing protein [Sinorhizobium meliloti]MDX0146463.1 alpha/beta hydrolase fold domain-containing protein [Sinorhizobium meliloti]MDX0152633.1 alpha/beta hydrolase fold domain-containing protein [Sinorhizobium meliloti]
MAGIVRLLLVLELLLFSATAFALDEKIVVQTRTLSEHDFLTGKEQAGQPVEITGTLAGPDTDERLPVVILLHGTDGPRSGAAWNWRLFLESIGVASFRLDSYTGRGIESADSQQELFGQFTQIYDTYRAMEALAEHPKIDANRIAVMGFSRGGHAALYSAMTRFQNAHGPKQGKLIAHLAFYPACNFELVGQFELSGAPIREFHGAEDDWTPAAPCRAYIDRLAAGGYDAQMSEFPGVLHSFDNTSIPARNWSASWQTSRKCLRREENGRLVNPETGKPFSYADACVEYGPSVQYNDGATAKAQATVEAFLLGDAFKLK